MLHVHINQHCSLPVLVNITRSLYSVLVNYKGLKTTDVLTTRNSYESYELAIVRSDQCFEVSHRITTLGYTVGGGS